jgi:hypothetical protein
MMRRLDVAAKRFSASLDGLEKALAEKAGNGPSTDVLSDLAVLKAERERLQSRIQELEEETRVLSGLTEEVEGRLDGAIAEIRAALGRN